MTAIDAVHPTALRSGHAGQRARPHPDRPSSTHAPPAGPVELVTITTEGDRSAAAIPQLGGTGVFVTAIRAALLEGSIDLAVHSYKDLPTAPGPA